MPSQVQAVGPKAAVHAWPQIIIPVPRIDYFKNVDVGEAQKREGHGVESAPTLNQALRVRNNCRFATPRATHTKICLYSILTIKQR
jgi:hypothetical protein